MIDQRATRLATAVYTALVRCYPAPFRARFGDEMSAVFAEACRDAIAEGGRMALAVLCLETACDFARSAVAEHWIDARRRSRSLANSAERGAYAAGVLLLGALPFLVIVKALAGPARTRIEDAPLLCALWVHCALMWGIVRVTERRVSAFHDSPGWTTRFLCTCRRLTALLFQLASTTVVIACARAPIAFVDHVRAAGAHVVEGSLQLSIPALAVVSAFVVLRGCLRFVEVNRVEPICLWSEDGRVADHWSE